MLYGSGGGMQVMLSENDSLVGKDADLGRLLAEEDMVSRCIIGGMK